MKMSLSSVLPCMCYQVATLAESFSTNYAFMRLFSYKNSTFTFYIRDTGSSARSEVRLT